MKTQKGNEKRKNYLKRLGMALCLALACAMPIAAKAAMRKTSIDGSALAIQGIDGNTYTPGSFSEDVVALFFGRTGCLNTTGMIRHLQSLTKCVPSVKPVLMLVDPSDSGMESYAGKNPGVLVAHQDGGYNRLMWTLLDQAGLRASTISLPGTFVMGKNREIVYASTGMDKDGLAEAVTEMTQEVHAYETVTLVMPTCTTPGERTQRCKNCGREKPGSREMVPAAGHSAGLPATCTKPQTCAACGEVLSEALGHSYVNRVVAPTDTKTGYTLHTCSRCGDSYKDNDVFLDADYGTSSFPATKASLKSLVNKKGKKAVVKIKKVSKADGYEIVYGTDHKLKKK